MKISGMIDRAKLAKRYINDEYVQPYMVYDHSMQVAYIDKAKLAGELQEGIAKEQFKVYYQPVIDTKTGKIASAEALIRWIHPDKGFISPALFIPISCAIPIILWTILFVFGFSPILRIKLISIFKISKS